MSNEAITINGGSQTRDFIYVTDIADTIFRAVQLTLETEVSDVVNVLTGASVSIDFLADELIEIVNSSSDKVYKKLPIGDPMESNGTINKLSRLLNVKPSDFLTLSEGLKMTVNSMKSRI